MTSATGAEGGSHLDKPLGRGLEEISHLFRAGIRSEATANEHPPGGSPPHAATSSPAGVVLLERRMPLTREQFTPLLKEFHGALEEGLTAIDSEIACPSCGHIDLLGLSRSNQLTIIDFSTNADDGLLIRGIGHLDWIARNLPIIRRLYANHTIDYSLPPGTVGAVAGRFAMFGSSGCRPLLRGTSATTSRLP